MYGTVHILRNTNSDVDMHLFIERGLRGGVSIITHRKGNSNNQYMKNYDNNMATKYVTYYDANNLYGWARVKLCPMEDSNGLILVNLF